MKISKTTCNVMHIMSAVHTCALFGWQKMRAWVLKPEKSWRAKQPWLRQQHRAQIMTVQFTIPRAHTTRGPLPGQPLSDLPVSADNGLLCYPTGCRSDYIHTKTTLLIWLFVVPYSSTILFSKLCLFICSSFNSKPPWKQAVVNASTSIRAQQVTSSPLDARCPTAQPRGHAPSARSLTDRCSVHQTDTLSTDWQYPPQLL